MIDSHCHFDFPEFDKDRKSVWQNSRASGINGLLIPGTEYQFFERVIRTSTEFENVWFALGLHPWFLPDDIESCLREYRRIVTSELDNHKFVAIGETGLDFGREIPQEKQVRSFEEHLALASELQLPVIVHHYKSHHKIIEILKHFPDVIGVIHAFSGSPQIAKSYVDMGFKLGIGGTITYERAQKTKRAIQTVGLSHVLLETDAPSMPVNGRQGQRNSPEYLCEVVRELADVLSIDFNDVIEQTTLNFGALFRKVTD